MHLGGHEGEERKGDNLRSPILEDGLEVIPGRGVEVSRGRDRSPGKACPTLLRGRESGLQGGGV